MPDGMFPKFDLFASNWGKAHREGLERGSPSKKRKKKKDKVEWWLDELSGTLKQENQISSLPVDPVGR